MKVLLSNVSRKNGYMIIDVFFSVLSGMNYPVLAHDDTMLKFIDVDEKFKKRFVMIFAPGRLSWDKDFWRFT